MSRTYRNLPPSDKRDEQHRQPTQTRFYARLADVCLDLDDFEVAKRNRIIKQTNHRPNHRDDYTVSAFKEIPNIA